MLKNRWVVATTAFVIVASLVGLSWTPRTVATPAGAEAEQTAFRGKVLLIRSSFGMESYVVERAQVRQFGSQAFLVGKAVESSSGRGDVKGKTLWLNMVSITAIIECEDTDGAKKMLKTLPGIGVPGVAIEGAATEVVPVPPPPPAEKDSAPLPPRKP